MLLMGKSTISTGPFSIAMLNYQRVYQISYPYPNHIYTDIYRYSFLHIPILLDIPSGKLTVGP